MPTGTISLSPGVKTAVEELLLLSQREFDPPPGEAWGAFFPKDLYELHGKFLDLLKALDRQVDEDLVRRSVHDTTGDIRCRLIAIAHDFSLRPERYEELVDSYARRPRRNAAIHVHRPPMPTPQDSVEKYRLTWELLLVAPCSNDSLFMRPACFKAIGIIRNDSSIPLLVHLYRRANAGVKSGFRRGQALDEQLRIIESLHVYRNSSALGAMLRCVAISENVPAPVPKASQFTMKEWTIRYLRDEVGVTDGNRWRPVIQKALEDKDLSNADRAFLENVLNKLPS